METAGPPVDYAYHRVVDPADPPRELSGLAWGVFVSLGVLALLCVVRLVTALHLHSAVSGRGEIESAYHTYHVWIRNDALAAGPAYPSAPPAMLPPTSP